MSQPGKGKGKWQMGDIVEVKKVTEHEKWMNGLLV